MRGELGGDSSLKSPRNEAAAPVDRQSDRVSCSRIRVGAGFQPRSILEHSRGQLSYNHCSSSGDLTYGDWPATAQRSCCISLALSQMSDTTTERQKMMELMPERYPVRFVFDVGVIVRSFCPSGISCLRGSTRAHRTSDERVICRSFLSSLKLNVPSTFPGLLGSSGSYEDRIPARRERSNAAKVNSEIESEVW